MDDTITRPGFAELAGARCIMLTTFRRSGAPVGTPVWPVYRDGSIYLSTVAESGKVKRIRADARVEVAACTQRGRVTGPPFAGRARVTAAGETAAVLAARHRRYPIVARLFELVNRIQGQHQVAIVIAPSD